MGEYKAHIQRMRQLIVEAMIVKLAEKPFCKITVQEITTEANIQKATFYRYFRDKYEVAEAVNQLFATQLTDGFFTHFYKGEGSDLDAAAAFFIKYRKVIGRMIQLRLENIDLPRKVLERFDTNYKAYYPDSSEFEAYLAGQNFLAVVTWLTGTDASFFETGADLHTGAQIRWFARYCNISPEELTDFIGQRHGRHPLP